jgi:hypothetical protein
MRYSPLVLVATTSLLVLASCGQTGTTPNDNAKAAVAAAQSALTGVGDTILACYQVPSCSKVAPKQQIKDAYAGAYAAVTKAQATADAGGTPDMTGTTAAMSALQSLMTKLPPS